MKSLVFACAVALAAAVAPGLAQAREHHLDACHVDSGYDVKLAADALLFSRTSGTPHSVEMSRGTLRVDGRDLPLSAADRERIAKYEATVRALVPQVKAIARDAADIAFTAIGEVANAFSGDKSSLHAKIDRLRGETRSRIDASFDSRAWNEHEFDALVESTIQELVPELVGNITAIAIKAALSGDEAVAKEMEARANKLEREIDERVELRTRQIEGRAEALCGVVADLAQLEATFDLRLPDGSSLKLLDVRRR